MVLGTDMSIHFAMCRDMQQILAELDLEDFRYQVTKMFYTVRGLRRLSRIFSFGSFYCNSGAKNVGAIHILFFSLRKQAHSNILKILQLKKGKFSDKNLWYFSYFISNIDRGYSLDPQGGSNEYQQSMFFYQNNKNSAYPCKARFYYIKVGSRGSKLYRHVFVMLFDHKKHVVGTH